MSVLQDIKKMNCKLVERRRHIHKNPELSGQEFETMRYICSQLDEFNVSYRSQLAGTGVLAEINGEKPGDRVLLLRADIDALPINEENKSEFTSSKSGVMHACGHDAHTAIMLGVCEYLQAHKADFGGKVKIAFQPLEETTGGAKPMIDEGVLTNPQVDACAALHVDPELDCGTVRVKGGAMYASPDDFEIVIHGKSGHGAQPELCIDPILTAAHVICALQSVVSRKVEPFDSAVVTIGQINGGSCSNAIPDSVTLVGTARAADNELRSLLEREIENIVSGVCSAFGAEYEYKFTRLFPPLINDEKIAKQIYNSAVAVLGKDCAIWGGKPTMAGEDFSYFTNSVPGAIFKLGCRNEKAGIVSPLHNAEFDLDENCMQYGAAVLADFAINFLNQ